MTIKLVWSPSLWTVVSSGCWEWNGVRTKNIDHHGNVRPWEEQYGVFGANGLAHRHALELKLGRPIGSGLLALHTCDNPSCVRPDHLYEGTQSDNMRDMHDRGRMNQPAYYEKSSHCNKCSFEFTPENTRVLSNGSRQCRNCRRVTARELNALIKRAKDALGITWREYIATYGTGKATARAIIANLEKEGYV
jgi:hypothetical protein